MRKLRYFFQLMVISVVIFSYFPVLLAEDHPKIDINSASAEELVKLKGIGVKKAAAIIEFRETSGPFLQPEDLLKVPGIGLKTFEVNKDRIMVKVD